MLQRLHHVAYRCLDAAETVDFYTNVIGLRFAHAISQDRVPSTQEFSPHLHIFFELGDGSYLAFFELGKAAQPQRDRIHRSGFSISPSKLPMRPCCLKESGDWTSVASMWLVRPTTASASRSTSLTRAGIAWK
jgi:catechol 2,3-dioxygenase-like lactoylglutathione lyase family enzyme